MTPNQRERLTRLADGLSNFKEWRKTFVTPKSFENKVKKVKVTFNILEWFEDECDDFCKTSACAVGSACFDPWFQKQGLKVKDDSPYFEDDYGQLACQKFFGLTGEEVEHLFTWKGYEFKYDNPKLVAKQIRKFLETH